LLDEKNSRVGYQGLGMLKSSLPGQEGNYLLSHFGLSQVQHTYGIKELNSERYSGEMDSNHIYEGRGFLQFNSEINTQRGTF